MIFSTLDSNEKKLELSFKIYFKMKEEFVGMWVLGIVSQYIVRLHRVTKNTTETSSWKKDLYGPEFFSGPIFNYSFQ